MSCALTNLTSMPNFPLPVSMTFPSPPNAARPTSPFAAASPFSSPSPVIWRMANLDERPDHAQHLASGCMADA